MGTITCNKCGNIFKSKNPRGGPKKVTGCSRCTRLFSDSTVDQILKEFKRKF